MILCNIRFHPRREGVLIELKGLSVTFLRLISTRVTVYGQASEFTALEVTPFITAEDLILWVSGGTGVTLKGFNHEATRERGRRVRNDAILLESYMNVVDCDLDVVSRM